MNNRSNQNSRTSQWITTILEQASKLEGNKGIEMLHNCGAACCGTSKLLDGAGKVREAHPEDADAETLFQAFKKEYYDSSNFTKHGSEITLIFENCTCPMVQEGVDHPFLCNCTVGYSHKIFETLFGHSVKVDLQESILRGSERCVQVIRVKDKFNN